MTRDPPPRETTGGTIRVGIGGWRFDPWRDTFYPPDLKRTDELRYASSVLAAIEINATFYRTQTEATFTAWRDTVPRGFVFAVKAPRAADLQGFLRRLLKAGPKPTGNLKVAVDVEPQSFL